MPKPDYDTSIARMAGNIAAALVRYDKLTGPYVMRLHESNTAIVAVSLARAIVAEIKRTQPQACVEVTRLDMKRPGA